MSRPLANRTPSRAGPRDLAVTEPSRERGGRSPEQPEIAEEAFPFRFIRKRRQNVSRVATACAISRKLSALDTIAAALSQCLIPQALRPDFGPTGLIEPNDSTPGASDSANPGKRKAECHLHREWQMALRGAADARTHGRADAPSSSPRWGGRRISRRGARLDRRRGVDGRSVLGVACAGHASATKICDPESRRPPPAPRGATRLLTIEACVVAAMTRGGQKSPYAIDAPRTKEGYGNLPKQPRLRLRQSRLKPRACRGELRVRRVDLARASSRVR